MRNCFVGAFLRILKLKSLKSILSDQISLVG